MFGNEYIGDAVEARLSSVVFQQESNIKGHERVGEKDG